MDFMTVLKYVIAVVETGALIGALTFLSRAFKETNGSPARRSLYIQGGVYAVVYLALNLLRNYFF